ncbi:MAG: prepilin peptidase [Terracidiphilus sp.]|jgi:leader peptidase (prepilin peptidase)/N-methyltransferase
MIRILGTIFAGLFGLAFGSFLNVCLSRWPAGESVVKPRSHCRQCNRTLTWWENVPLVSWLALRGRCRTCRAWIGWRYPLVELAVGGLWAVVAWEFRTNVLDPDLPRFALYDSLMWALGMMLFYWVLVALAALDAENLWLPNWLTLPWTAAGFVLTVVGFAITVELHPVTSRLSLTPLYLRGEEWHLAWPRLLEILAAATIIMLIRWVYWLIRHREGIGLGDAKLMALLAAWLGLPLALLAFVVGVVLGALVALGQLAIPAARNQSERWALGKLPLGTFLCFGGIVSSLWGQAILAAYRRWAGF